MSDFDGELERARGVYAARAGSAGLAKLYGPFAPANLLTIQNRDWAIAYLLRRSGISSLAGLDILDVGCGSGGELRRMTTMGADPARLAGIDLMPARIEEARRLLPAARFEVGSAHELPFADNSFDLVSQFVLFSSIVHPGLRRAVALEMARVLRPGGSILWYDIKSMRPTSDLVPIKLDEMRALFPGAEMRVRSTTLGWRANHLVAPRSRVAAILLDAVPWLRSHYVALIRPGKR